MGVVESVARLASCVAASAEPEERLLGVRIRAGSLEEVLEPVLGRLPHTFQPVLNG